MSVASLFHPAVAAWFERSFAAPTAAQAQAWPAIQAGRHTLIAAPDRLGQDAGGVPRGDRRAGAAGRSRARLPDETQVVYVSPLKALSNDIQQNLRGAARRHPRGACARRACRTSRSAPGCAPATRRRPSASACAAARRTSWSPRRSRSTSCSARESGRAMLATTRTVIVDEIHARGAEQARLAPGALARAAGALCGDRLTRIGLSATQKPIEEVARFLVGRRTRRRPARMHASSTPAIAARATSRSRCRPRRSKR